MLCAVDVLLCPLNNAAWKLETDLFGRAFLPNARSSVCVCVRAHSDVWNMGIDCEQFERRNTKRVDRLSAKKVENFCCITTYVVCRIGHRSAWIFTRFCLLSPLARAFFIHSYIDQNQSNQSLNESLHGEDSHSSDQWILLLHDTF